MPFQVSSAAVKALKERAWKPELPPRPTETSQDRAVCKVLIKLFSAKMEPSQTRDLQSLVQRSGGGSWSSLSTPSHSPVALYAPQPFCSQNQEKAVAHTWTRAEHLLSSTAL